jgi:hypothetical protein
MTDATRTTANDAARGGMVVIVGLINFDFLDISHGHITGAAG